MFISRVHRRELTKRLFNVFDIEITSRTVQLVSGVKLANCQWPNTFEYADELFERCLAWIVALNFGRASEENCGISSASDETSNTEKVETFPQTLDRRSIRADPERHAGAKMDGEIWDASREFQI